MQEIITLDLNFLGRPGIIASYILPHADGLVMIECGPGSTVAALESALGAHGYTPQDVTDLLVTHIHLDHAGASGWLARRGARVHVHFRGLPHLQNPERLLASAGRIYGDQMDYLWGEMLPVPAESLHPLHDGDEFKINGISMTAHDTPGHATHHMSYQLGDLCFSGDIGGIRLAGPRHIVMPMPPPEFHLELWRESWGKLSALGIKRIAPTHFGIYEDAGAHLQMLGETVSDTASWIARTLPGASLEEVEREIEPWMESLALRHGLTKEAHGEYEVANPSTTSAAGIYRYWRKFRSPEAGERNRN